jgi:signal transduction histidine kinase
VMRLPSAVLRVPLLAKLLGANVLLVLAMAAVHYAIPATSTVVELAALLVSSFAVTGWLAWLALRPVASLEATAERVSRGDFTARAPMSRIADRQMLGLTETMNRLLDRVETDRARIHYLAGRGVRARDIERETVARELRDSFAQTLAGVAMQLAAAQRANADPEVAIPLEQTRTLIQNLTEDMRSVAETLYPGTLSEFGLLNALEALGRRVSRRSNLDVEVKAEVFLGALSARAASALYHVAEEALRNVEQHAQAHHARVTLSSNGHVTLEVEDDGRGIDMTRHDPLQAGLGLFSAKAVLALTGGELQISSGPGLGTRVTARVPSGETMVEEGTGNGKRHH